MSQDDIRSKLRNSGYGLTMTATFALVGTWLGSDNQENNSVEPLEPPPADIEIVQKQPAKTIKNNAPTAQITLPLPLKSGYILTFNDPQTYIDSKRLYERANKEAPHFTSPRDGSKDPIPQEFVDSFFVNAVTSGVPYEFWRDKSYQESGFDSEAISSTGNLGAYQLGRKATMDGLVALQDKKAFSFFKKAHFVNRKLDGQRKKPRFVYTISPPKGVSEKEMFEGIQTNVMEAGLVTLGHTAMYFPKFVKKAKIDKPTTKHLYVFHLLAFTQGKAFMEESRKNDPNNPDRLAYSFLETSRNGQWISGKESPVYIENKFLFRDSKRKADRSYPEFLDNIEKMVGNIPVPTLEEWGDNGVTLSRDPDYVPEHKSKPKAESTAKISPTEISYDI